MKINVDKTEKCDILMNVEGTNFIRDEIHVIKSQRETEIAAGDLQLFFLHGCMNCVFKWIKKW